MKLARASRPDRGIALIIVMIVITFLTILVAGFSYSMKVESKLARNAVFDPEMEWLGKSGIELAKYVIGQQRMIASENWDSLNQKWAGGVGNSNSAIANVQMTGVQLGRGTFSVKITDCESKFNINTANEIILQQAMTLIGVDASEIPPAVASIQDWIDADNQTHMGGGTESDFYMTQDPPYEAKNGPIDDIAELLLIRNISPEMYWGPRYSGAPMAFVASKRRGLRGAPEQVTYATGLIDLFTPFGSGLLNLNTAGMTALQVIPEIDENVAAAIISRRNGLDGTPGTDDDMPFRSPGEIASVPGIPPPVAGAISRYFTVMSTAFEVEVDVQLDQRNRKFHAIVRRVDPKNIVTMTMYWK